MGKANFYHLASQNILLLIVLVIFIFYAITRGAGYNQLFFIVCLLVGPLSQNRAGIHNALQNNKLTNSGCWYWQQVLPIVTSCGCLGNTFDIVLMSAGPFPWNVQFLSFLPQAFSGDTEFLSQFRFGHMILVFQNKFLEVIFEGNVVERILLRV